MADSVRFGMLALLLFFLGVVYQPAQAYAEEARGKACAENPHAPYELKSSNKYADSGEWKNPIGKETIDALGVRGLRLIGVALEMYKAKERYVYWFICGAPVEYQVLSLPFATESGGLLAKRRLDTLYGGAGKWIIAAVVNVRGTTWYYLVRDKTSR